MLTTVQALILGLLQGATELFPVSSLGHMVIFPTLVGWRVDQNDPVFLAFIIVTHIATALVLLIYFWTDWYRIVLGMIRSLRMRIIDPADTYAKLGWLLVASSVPVGVLGILFEKQLSTLFAVPFFAGIFLIGNGVLLYTAEHLVQKRAKYETYDHARIAELSWGKAARVGFFQCLALLPGFSRTGATLVGGLTANLSHQDAAHFAFLLATPIILAAGVLKIPELALSGESIPVGSFTVGALSAAIAAYFSVRYLAHYFKTKTLKPFAYYCVALGMLTLLIVR